MVTERILPARPRGTPFPSEGAAVAPFQFPLDGNEYVRVSMLSAVAGATVALQGRWLRPSGEIANFAYTLRTAIAMVVVEEEFQLGAGALLSVFAQPTTQSIAGGWGDTYLTLTIVRGRGPNAVELGVLIQSYVAFMQPAVWPGTPIRSSLAGYGRPEAFTLSNPAPGAFRLFTGSTGIRYRISTIQLAFVADATAGNRFVSIRLIRGGNQVARFNAPAAHAPGTGENYFFVAGGAAYATAAGGYQYAPLPRALWFDTTDQIEVSWLGTVGAADQLSGIVVDTERWLILPGQGIV